MENSESAPPSRSVVVVIPPIAAADCLVQVIRLRVNLYSGQGLKFLWFPDSGHRDLLDLTIRSVVIGHVVLACRIGCDTLNRLFLVWIH